MNGEEPWYHGGLRFRCAGCGACCTGTPGYVWVNKAEIAALAAAVGLAIEEFERKCVRAVGIRRSLVEYPSGDCVLFDTQSRRCSVYAVRPRQCRTWPFWESNLRGPESWEETARCCPGANRGPLVTCSNIQARLRVMHV